MSTELDAFFTALRHDADEMPAAAPDTVRGLGRRRRRRAALAAAVAAFVVVGTIAVAIGIGLPGKGRPQPAVTPTTASTPTTFQPLTPVGPGIGYGTARPPRLGSTVTMGDRAFVCLQGETGETSVVAVDLLTGRSVWGPVRLADFDDVAFVSWHPRYVLVLGRQDNGTRPDGAVFALDPRTGKVLLHVDVDNFEADDIVIGESTLVIGSRSTAATRGYDLGTGRVRWTVADPPSRIVHSSGIERAAGSPVVSQRGGLGGSALAAGRFVQLTADGTAIVRDLDTGAESARRAGAVAAAGAGGEVDRVLAVDDTLYVLGRERQGEIRAMDLAGKRAATTVYTAEDGVEIGSLIWCGAARICFSEQRPPDVSRFVGFDLGAGKVRWRQDGYVSRLQFVDGLLLLNATAGQGDPRSVLFDPSDRQMLDERAQDGIASWVGGDALLIMRPARDGGTTEVLGVSPLGGAPVPLGTVDGNLGCGWSGTHLVCVATAGIKVWRFAG